MIQLFLLDDVDTAQRGEIFPLLKAFYKSKNFNDEKRIKIYGFSEKEINLTSKIENAKFAVLPMSWNYYTQKKIIPSVAKKIAHCSLTVLSFCNGDFGVPIPHLKNLVVFRCNGETLKLPKTHQGFPVFIRDPQKEYFNNNPITLSPYNTTPIIGFCGQADTSFTTYIKELGRTIFRNLLYYLKLRKQLPQQLIATSLLRAKVLHFIQKDSSVKSNFIFRKKYRAGAQTLQQRFDTALTFYNNMQQSDYIVCVRGGGNFSVRFFEALAMGKIPVLINTNGFLPLEQNIDWSKHIITIPYHKRYKAARIIAHFHQQHTPETFKNLQLQNRKLWEESLTLGGFFKTYFNI